MTPDPTVARVSTPLALCLALAGSVGCHLLSGATDYDTSFAVGDWQSSVPYLGMRSTMNLDGDGNGKAAIPRWVQIEGSLRRYPLGFQVSWTATDDTNFELHLVCVDGVCTGAPVVMDAHCVARQDGAELFCAGLSQADAQDTLFERVP